MIAGYEGETAYCIVVASGGVRVLTADGSAATTH